jgi:hypothetical protein
MNADDASTIGDALAQLIEADREGRSSRIFTRSAAAGADGSVGRAVAYRLGSERHSIVFRVTRDEREIVVDVGDLVRVERV